MILNMCIFLLFYICCVHVTDIRMDQVMQFIEPAKQFSKDSIRLVKRCTKPDRKGMIYFIMTGNVTLYTCSTHFILFTLFIYR